MFYTIIKVNLRFAKCYNKLHLGPRYRGMGQIFVLISHVHDCRECVDLKIEMRTAQMGET
jgi:hypothetical protein